MTTYRIHSKVSGQDMGSFKGETIEQAYEALCKDAGHTGARQMTQLSFQEAPYLCDACNEPVGDDYMTDDEVCGNGDGPGFILCDRRVCRVKCANMNIEERRAHFAKQREIRVRDERIEQHMLTASLATLVRAADTFLKTYARVNGGIDPYTAERFGDLHEALSRLTETNVKLTDDYEVYEIKTFLNKLAEQLS